jgi:hypothetical protein
LEVQCFQSSHKYVTIYLSNMEAGLTFNLSNFFPPHYMEAIQIGSYKTKWLSVLLSAVIFMCDDLTFLCLILFTGRYYFMILYI